MGDEQKRSAVRRARVQLARLRLRSARKRRVKRAEARLTRRLLVAASRVEREFSFLEKFLAMPVADTWSAERLALYEQRLAEARAGRAGPAVLP